jgi:hypothetical protein
MIKGLGDMLGGAIGDKVTEIAGDAAGPVIAQVLELVQGLLEGGDISSAQEGALGQLAEMLGVGTPQEILAMGAEKIAESGIAGDLGGLMKIIETLKV